MHRNYSLRPCRQTGGITCCLWGCENCGDATRRNIKGRVQDEEDTTLLIPQ